MYSTTSRSLTKDLSKDSLYRKIAQSKQASQKYELDTTDRLCTLKDIDNYFNELCQESRPKLAAVQTIVNYVKSSPHDKVRSPRGNSTKGLNSPISAQRSEEIKSATKSNIIYTAILSRDVISLGLATLKESDWDRAAGNKKRVVGFSGVWPQLDEEAIE